MAVASKKVHQKSDANDALRFSEHPQIVGQYRIKEMHQQIAVFLRAEQGFEYAIYFRVYAVFH